MKTRHVCQSMHKVVKAEDFFPQGSEKCVLKCRLNPMRLLCTCKGSRHHGICSHILAYTHLMRAIDIKDQLQALSALGGQWAAPTESGRAIRCSRTSRRRRRSPTRTTRPSRTPSASR